MTTRSTNRGLILLVDDTPTNLEMLVDCLSDHGFEGSVAKMVFDVKNEEILCAAKTIIVHFTGIFSSATR